VRREMVPEEGDTESAVGAVKGALQAFKVVHIGFHHFGPEPGQRLGLLRIGVPGERAGSVFAAAVGADGADQTAALRPSCACNRNDLFAGHNSSCGVGFYSLTATAKPSLRGRM